MIPQIFANYLPATMYHIPEDLKIQYRRWEHLKSFRYFIGNLEGKRSIDMIYSDTSANEDNSFRNHIR